MAENEPTTMWCGQCAARLPLAAFYRSKSSSNGHLPWCKACRRRLKAELRAANPEKSRAKDRKRDRDPEKMKQSQVRWRANNAALAASRSAESRKKKHTVYLERERAYKKAFPELVRADDARRRARKASALGNGWTAADVVEVRRLQHGCCALCRKKLLSRFHRDHIVPLKLGGAHDRRNLQLLCEPCNLSKGARDPLVHSRSLGLLL